MQNSSRSFGLRRIVSVLVSGAALIALGGCRTTPTAASLHPPDARWRVAVAEIHQETNSFSPVPTGMVDFQAAGIWRGEEIVQHSLGAGTAIDGFLHAVADLGKGEVEIVPILRATAMSGGPVVHDVYEQFKTDIVEGLRAAGRVDAVYLPLHGAMGVEGVRDPEGDLLEAVRSVVGPDIPVAVSFDLHANLTERRAKLATFIVGYKTNPHRDHYQTGYDSTRILLRTLRGEVRPVMVVRKMRLLEGGGMNIDFLAPMAPIFSRMKAMERSAGVLSVSTFMVHIWLDDPELGWSTVAVTDGNQQLAEKTADELADRSWAVRAVPHDKGMSAAEAVDVAKRSWLARAFGTIVVCDASDAVGAGAPGDSTIILQALLDKGKDMVSYVPIRDPAAVAALWDHAEGDTVTISVGGGFGKPWSSPVQMTGTVLRKRTIQEGRAVILREGGIHAILTELPVAAAQPSFFTNLGLSLWKADFVVVRNLFPFRYNYALYNRMTLDVITPGASDVDVTRLPYVEVPRPIYPLDPVETWR